MFVLDKQTANIKYFVKHVSSGTFQPMRIVVCLFVIITPLKYFRFRFGTHDNNRMRLWNNEINSSLSLRLGFSVVPFYFFIFGRHQSDLPRNEFLGAWNLDRNPFNSRRRKQPHRSPKSTNRRTAIFGASRPGQFCVDKTTALYRERERNGGCGWSIDMHIYHLSKKCLYLPVLITAIHHSGMRPKWIVVVTRGMSRRKWAGALLHLESRKFRRRKLLEGEWFMRGTSGFSVSWTGWMLARKRSGSGPEDEDNKEKYARSGRRIYFIGVYIRQLSRYL